MAPMIGIAQAQLSPSVSAGSTSAGSTEVTDGTYRVTGLFGVNSGTSQFSLQADTISLWRSSDRTRRYVSGTSAIVNDIGTTGNNGRDQAGAFTANNWLHFYFVGGNAVTSSTLATRSSLTAPPTGPTLPSSETHWAYTGAVRLDTSTALQPTRMMDSWVMNNIADGGVNRVLSAGRSTTAVAVDCSSVIAPNSRLGVFNFIVAFDNATETATLTIKPTGSTEAGQQIMNYTAGSPIVASGQQRNSAIYPVSSSQFIDYNVNATTAQAFIDVLGFQIPNGGA